MDFEIVFIILSNYVVNNAILFAYLYVESW